MKTRFTTYKDKHGFYRWKAFRAGRNVANGSEGYTRPSKCLRSLLNFIKSIKRGDYSIDL